MSQASSASQSESFSTEHGKAIIPPPPRVSPPKNTLWQDLQQGFEYLRFVWNVSKRIRGLRNRFRFIVGLILWKPILPQDDLD